MTGFGCISDLLELIVEHSTRSRVYSERDDAFFRGDQILNAASATVRRIGRCEKTTTAFSAALVTNSVDVPISWLTSWLLDLPVLTITSDFSRRAVRKILADVNPSVALLSADFHAATRSFSHEVCINPFSELNFSRSALPALSNSQAYLALTSGSTGEAKASINTSSGLINRVKWMISDVLNYSPAKCIQTTNPSYDSSLWQILLPLCTGGTAYMPMSPGALGMVKLADLLLNFEANIIDFTPTLFRSFHALNRRLVCRSVKVVIFGGESLALRDIADAQRMFPAARILNLYGPSECAIGSVFCDVSNHTEEIIPIGRPIPNTNARILDEHGEPVRPGVAGELELSGVCVGDGYYGRAAESGGFSLGGGNRRYRTGDIAYVNEKGDIVLLGRNNNFIKVNGTRHEFRDLNAKLSELKEFSSLNLQLRTSAGGIVISYKGKLFCHLDDLRSALTGVMPAGLTPEIAERVTVVHPSGKEFEEFFVVGHLSDCEKVLEGSQDGIEGWDIDWSKSFREQGYDSLNAVQFQMALEEAGTSIEIQDILSDQSLEAVLSRSRLGSTSVAHAPSALRIRRSRRELSEAGVERSLYVIGANGFIGCRVFQLASEDQSSWRRVAPVTSEKFESWLDFVSETHEAITVINCAGQVDWTCKQDELLSKNVDVCRRILLNVPASSRVVSLSSLSVAGEWKGRKFTENDIDLGQNFLSYYGFTKMLGELWTQRIVEARGDIEACNVRLGAVGPPSKAPDERFQKSLVGMYLSQVLDAGESVGEIFDHKIELTPSDWAANAVYAVAKSEGEFPKTLAYVLYGGVSLSEITGNKIHGCTLGGFNLSFDKVLEAFDLEYSLSHFSQSNAQITGSDLRDYRASVIASIGRV